LADSDGLICPNPQFVAACWITALEESDRREEGLIFPPHYLLGETPIAPISTVDENDRHFSLLRFCSKHSLPPFGHRNQVASSSLLNRLAFQGSAGSFGHFMHWFTPTAKDIAIESLETRIWGIPEQFRANSGRRPLFPALAHSG
jgi:hypothetical protein